MTTRPTWAPAGIDIDRPSAARAYDYVLGGIHNFEVDRQLARRLTEATPDLAQHARANRAFLQRATRYLVGAGVRQFLDLGSGIPTNGNLHEVAQSAAPDSRVVYVDIDPVAVAHSRQILADVEHCAIVEEDLRRMPAILEHEDVRRLIDFDRPVAVLLLALLHAIPDTDEPYKVLAGLRDRLAPGSYLVISHSTGERRPDEARKMEELSKKSPTALHMRSREEIGLFFEGYELVEPGLTWVSQWRPDPAAGGGAAEQSDMLLGGVGRKP
ncbi:MAG: SAM-dependent methyltransferase [Catenulispora sp.]